MMFRTAIFRTLIPLLTLCLFLSGCDAAATQSNAMKRFGLAYHNFVDEYKCGPENWDELLTFVKETMPGDVSAVEGLRDANYTVAWGRYQFSDVHIGTSNFILLYSPAVAEQGGEVLTMDGQVQHKTAGAIDVMLKRQQQEVQPTGTKQGG